jgi:hypothetical protein
MKKLVFSLLLASAPAWAVGTRTFQLDSLDKLSGGEVKGAAIGSDGVVRSGLSLGSLTLSDATGVFASLAMSDGSLLVGTSPNGKIYRVANDQSSVFAETGALAVTSMVQGKDGSVYAATMPDGKIFRVAQGKAELYATLKDAGQVWALALSKNGLFAAAGPEGRVFKVERGDASTVYFKSDEANLVSLMAESNGDLLVGSSGKGILYRVTGPGRASVLHDFAGDEVKAIAPGPDGSTFVVVNEYSEPPEPPRRLSGAAGKAPGPASGSRPKPGKGSLYRIDKKGRVERLMKHDEFHYLSLSVDERGAPYVGTGSEGRVYTVDDAHAVTLVADTDERQIGALSVSANGGFVVSGDPAIVHRVLGRGSADATWTSKALDCTFAARFGNLDYQTEGAVEVQTRSGNTQAPDTSWSAWSTSISAGQKVASPSGRFLQIRAKLKDRTAALRGVSVAFVTENMRAIVTDVDAVGKGAPSREPLTSVPSTGGDAAKHEPVMKLSWKVDNADNDALRYRVEFRKEGQTLWRSALKAEETLTKAEYEWDTSSLAEGRYRVRVEATDEFVNPPGEGAQHALISDPFIVDNTPPVFRSLEVRGRKITAQVVDGLGPVTRVEVAIDGRTEFRPLGAKDGIYDTKEETVEADLTAVLPTGPHIVTVRAYDAAGNVVMAEREVP